MARSLNPFSIVTQKTERELTLRLTCDDWKNWDVQYLLRVVQDLAMEKWRVAGCKVADEKVVIQLYRYVSAWRAFLQPHTIAESED